MTYQDIHAARFLARPNRFIAQVELEGRVETVHVKNTGRCKELLLPGCTVYLEGSQSRSKNKIRPGGGGEGPARPAALIHQHGLPGPQQGVRPVDGGGPGGSPGPSQAHPAAAGDNLGEFSF